MLHIELLDATTVKPYLLLTQPGSRRWLLDDIDELAMIVLGARFLSHPVGVLVVQRGEDRIHLLDIYVLPDYRRMGIAGKLLQTLEAHCAWPHLQALYKADDHTHALQQLLAKQGWNRPKHSRIIFGSVKTELLSQPTIYRLRPPFEVCAWADVTSAERQEIRRRGDAGWYPRELSPFLRPDPTWDAQLSVALRRHADILGWVLVDRIADDEIMVEVMFVDPPLQPLGRGIMLVAEMARRAVAAGVTCGYWGVSPDNQPMLRWSRQAADWLLIDEYDEWLSEKQQ